MASPFIKSNRMKTLESKKSHSWWDSHISPKNSKWLQENLEEMDQNVKRMLKLVEEDADSFSKKVELYLKKRPELISLVEEFYRIYRALAERYDNVTGELRKSIPSDLQSQSSGVSDAGSDPVLSADRRPGRTKSGLRAAGFDFFLGSDKGDESSTLDSDSESDENSSVNNYSAEENGQLRSRIGELESELRAMKEKAQPRIEEVYEEAKASDDGGVEKDMEFIEPKQNQLEIQESVDGSEFEVGLEHRILTLEEEVRVMREKVHESEEELTKKGAIVQSLQGQLKTANKEIPLWKNKVDKEKREVSRLLDRMTRYKNNLSDRDQEIRALKEAISNADKSLSEENNVLKLEMTRMTKEKNYLEDNIKELDLRCQSLEEEVRRAKAAKAEVEIALGNRIEVLKIDISERDSRAEELSREIDELKRKHDRLLVGKEERISEVEERLKQVELQHAELRLRVEELEKEVSRKQELILEGEEGKREAIRQLCFSIEHYREEYVELRRVVMVHRRHVVMAA